MGRLVLSQQKHGLGTKEPAQNAGKEGEDFLHFHSPWKGHVIY